MRRASMIGEEDRATVAAVLLDKYVEANPGAVSDARATEGVPAGMKVLRHGEFSRVANIIKDKLGVPYGEAETYLRLAMSRKPMGLGPSLGARRSSMRGRDIYQHPQGHFMSEHDLHLMDDSELEHLQSTTDEDLDGKDDADDDSMVDEDGYAAMTPAFDESETLEALEEPMATEPQAELEPQEAYEAMQFMAPLDDEEDQILATTPMLRADPRGHGHPVRWVDDPDHFEWLTQRIKDRQNAMDEVLEDQMYGDEIDGLTEEEMMDRAGSEVFDDDSGWSPFGAIRKVGRGIARGARGIARGARAVGKGIANLPRSAWSTVRTFIPGRDRQKAALIRSLNAKLVKEHTNYLMVMDRRRGVRKPRAAYTATARRWSARKIRGAGLPTSFSAGAGSDTASSILGSDTMGDWWNPFTWFKSKTNYVLINTQGERMAEMSETEYEAFKGTRAAQSLQEQVQQGPPGSGPPQEVGPPPEAYGPPPEAYAPPPEAMPPEAYGPPPEIPAEGVEGLFLDGEGNIIRGGELSGS